MAAAISRLSEESTIALQDPSAVATQTSPAARDPLGDTSPRRWQEVFDERLTVSVEGDEFCCYTAGLKRARTHDVVCVFLHGGGHCALSWGLVADIVKKSCGVVAFDSRGHGESRCEDEADLSAEMQVADATAVVRGVFAQRGEQLPKIVLVGHSMGGAIAVRLAAASLLGSNVKGLVVIDVVEGTAMAALPHMLAWLQRRANSFESVEKGVRYVLKARHIRNVASARLSVPQQLVYREEFKRWEWRTDLEESAEYWPGWFKGLSKLFLSVPGAKMLVLAGVDRLDKELMIGQMMGKFQQQVLPEAGHCVHEDRPEQTATVLLDYLRRNLFIDASDGSDVAPSIYQQRSPVPK
jgi:protein phosphatase methylesterase 1